MANACIAYTNLIDDGPTITATSSKLLLPVSNITVPHVARKWRGATIGGDSIIIDLGSAQDFDTVAVFGISGDAITVKTSLVDPTGVAGEVSTDANSVNDYSSQIVLQPSPISARYVRIDIDNATDFAEVGRVFIGLRTTFPYNFGKGWSRIWNDLSRRKKTVDGQTQIFPGSVYRTYDVTFDFISQTDRDGFVETVDRVNAMKTDVLFISNPASANLSRDSVWGLMVALTPVVQPSVSTFTKQYTIEERL